MGLYHKDVYLPKEQVNKIAGLYQLRFSHHAINACLSDRYGMIVPPKQIQINENNVIELEIAQNQVNKIVVRIDYNQFKDLVLVLLPDGFCKTVWLNEKSDKHKTLNKSVYARA
jgi:hypothetical protein